MKGITRERLNYLWFSLIVVLLAVACSKSGKPGTEPPPTIPTVPNEAEKTPVGTPIGNAEQQQIGTNGGIFTAAGGRITLDFPSGALNTNTTITIQPVTNNCPGGTGDVMRITPHNVNFNKPVKLGFSYSDS